MGRQPRLPDTAGKHYDYNSHHDAWRRILATYFKQEVNSLPADDYFRPHFMRHVSCSLMFEQGVPLQLAAQILGHSSEETTEIYLHLAREQRLDTVQRLERGLSGATLAADT